MRIVHELLLHITQDNAQLQTHFQRAQTASRITIDTYTKHTSGDFSVADTETEQLTIGNVASPAKGLYLETNADCDVTINGTLGPIQMRKATNASFAKLFLECDITSIEVEASQGSAVQGTYVVWGEVAAP